MKSRAQSRSAGDGKFCASSAISCCCIGSLARRGSPFERMNRSIAVESSCNDEKYIATNCAFASAGDVANRCCNFCWLASRFVTTPRCFFSAVISCRYPRVKNVTLPVSLVSIANPCSQRSTCSSVATRHPGGGSIVGVAVRWVASSSPARGRREPSAGDRGASTELANAATARPPATPIRRQRNRSR